MLRYRIQQAIMHARSALSLGTLIATPYLTYQLSEYANSLRPTYGLGGELFLPAVMVGLAYLIFPKYEMVKIRKARLSVSSDSNYDRSKYCVIGNKLYLKDENGVEHVLKFYERIGEQMGTLGRKIDHLTATTEYMKLRELIKKYHCQLGIDNILVSGSIRRNKRVDIGDVDVILVTTDGKISPKLAPILKNEGYSIDAAGSAMIRMLTEDEVQIDIYSCDEQQLPAMMAYLTGPSEYNIQMRSIAKKKGFKLNQVALMKAGTNDEVLLESEEHLFNILGCDFIEPEDRINFYDSIKYHKHTDLKEVVI